MRAALMLLASITTLWAGPAGAASRRFAVLVANNEGGESTRPLRYAKNDAEKMADVLSLVGGFAREDITVLVDGRAADFRATLADLESRVAKAKRDGHVTVIVYYSGHARDGALRLGTTRMPMKELRRHLMESSADVRMGIVDACEAGAITREKGGRPGPSFLFDTEDVAPSRGLILITSSAEDENSQESDEISGSFFTHYLTSGLRGDADESGDRRVTLDELYRYAYHRTVTQTADSRSGVQHPTYSFDLKGNGNLVLTDLSRGRSGVVFDLALEGHYMIFDMARDQVAAEIRKTTGKARRLALPPGEYVIKKRLNDHLRMVRFEIPRDGYFSVREADMEQVAFEDDYAKGAEVVTYVESRPTAAALKLALVYQSFLSGNARDTLFPPITLLALGFELQPVASGRLAFEVAVGGRDDRSLALSTLELPYTFFEAQLAVAMLWGVGGEHWSLAGGPKLAAIYLSRSFPSDPVLRFHVQDHFTLSPALAGAFRYGFGDRGDGFLVEVRSTLGFLSFSVDDNRALLYAQLGVAIGYEF